LLLQVKAGTDHLEDGHLVAFSWLQLINVANCSPSNKVLRFWTLELAMAQYLFANQDFLFYEFDDHDKEELAFCLKMIQLTLLDVYFTKECVHCICFASWHGLCK
jgi:hypothetical protein